MDLIGAVDEIRKEVSASISAAKKAKLGQFFTPAPVATQMASMFSVGDEVRLLDAGAGIGSLLAAVTVTCTAKRLHITAFEIDETVLPYLRKTIDLCEVHCSEQGIEFAADVHSADFLEYAASGPLLSTEKFTHAILNPPYFKISTDSRERKLIRKIGVETTNIYAGFLAGAISLLEQGGQLVAITPRSFCNGPYFRPFRRFLLKQMSLRRIHVFETRNKAFREDSVLQENVIFHAMKTARKGKVTISSSLSAGEGVQKRVIDYKQVIDPGNADQVIHIAPDDEAERVADEYARFQCTLEELDIEVSTGRVVDFRAKEHLRRDPECGSSPLIYPVHLREGFVDWPNGQKRKPNAIHTCDDTKRLLVPNEHYVLVKRFSAKEERRRITAAVYDPGRVECDAVGFENHLNYFHRNGGGIEPALAKGLAVFLNSSLVDAYFRQFSGHTQVNATDLRSMRYPTREELLAMGKRFRSAFPDQEQADAILASCTSRESPLPCTA